MSCLVGIVSEDEISVQSGVRITRDDDPLHGFLLYPIHDKLDLLLARIRPTRKYITHHPLRIPSTQQLFHSNASQNDFAAFGIHNIRSWIHPIYRCWHSPKNLL